MQRGRDGGEGRRIGIEKHAETPNAEVEKDDEGEEGE